MYTYYERIQEGQNQPIANTKPGMLLMFTSECLFLWVETLRAPLFTPRCSHPRQVMGAAWQPLPSDLEEAMATDLLQ